MTKVEKIKNLELKNITFFSNYFETDLFNEIYIMFKDYHGIILDTNNLYNEKEDSDKILIFFKEENKNLFSLYKSNYMFRQSEIQERLKYFIRNNNQKAKQIILDDFDSLIIINNKKRIKYSAEINCLRKQKQTKKIKLELEEKFNILRNIFKDLKEFRTTKEELINLKDDDISKYIDSFINTLTIELKNISDDISHIKKN